MKPFIKTKGFGAVKTMLRNTARRVPDVARGQMKRSAKRTVDLAKIMAPEDEGNLSDSIRIEKTYGDRGRLQIDIVVGNRSVTTVDGKVIDLNSYALLVHEAYETAVATKSPGPKTLQKMAENPSIKIGSGFLTRALEKEMDLLGPAMIEAIKEIIKEEGG